MLVKYIINVIYSFMTHELYKIPELLATTSLYYSQKDSLHSFLKH